MPCTRLVLYLRAYCHLLYMLLVYFNHLLYLVIAAHEDPRPIMDMFRNDSEHAFHTAVDRLATS